MFRPNKDARMFGYAAFNTPQAAALGSSIRKLHFMRADVVLTDLAAGHVKTRPRYCTALQLMREGDRLVIDAMTSLGSKPERQAHNAARIEAMGSSLGSPDTFAAGSTSG